MTTELNETMSGECVLHVRHRGGEGGVWVGLGRVLKRGSAHFLRGLFEHGVRGEVCVREQGGGAAWVLRGFACTEFVVP